MQVVADDVDGVLLDGVARGVQQPDTALRRALVDPPAIVGVQGRGLGLQLVGQALALGDERRDPRRRDPPPSRSYRGSSARRSRSPGASACSRRRRQFIVQRSLPPAEGGYHPPPATQGLSGPLRAVSGPGIPALRHPVVATGPRAGRSSEGRSRRRGCRRSPVRRPPARSRARGPGRPRTQRARPGGRADAAR